MVLVAAAHWPSRVTIIRFATPLCVNAQPPWDRRIAYRLTHREPTWPDLPAALDGLRIAHLSDLHVRGRRSWHDRLIETLGAAAPDLVALTGDFMSRNAPWRPAWRFVERLAGAMEPRVGFVGCFGNHDASPLRDAVGRVAGVRMLCNESWAVPGLPLDVAGLWTDEHGGGEDVARAMAGLDAAAGRFRLMLAHLPVFLDAAAGAGVDLMLSGHTHGGQVRLPGKLAFSTSCHWPARHPAGHFVRRRTRLILSRGLGESVRENLRLNCPRQLPMLTLRRGALDDESGDRLTVIERW